MTMVGRDLLHRLDVLVGGLTGDRRAVAWAALTHHVVLASGRELGDRTSAARRLGELLSELSAEIALADVGVTTRLLLVEDSDLVARSIARLLGGSYAVVRAADGAAARDLLLGGASFDVVFSDVNMPRLDGLEFLRWLQRTRPELLPRVVFMTADPDLPRARLIAAEHVHPVLRKPCTRAMLLDAVRAALGAAAGGRDGSP